MLLRSVIGAALRRIRQNEGRTLREVASSANISMPYLSEIERGRKEPSSEILAGICAALGLTVVDLLHEAAVEGRRSEGLLVDLTAPVAPVTAIRSVHERVDAAAPAHSAPDRGGEIALAAA